MKLLVASILAMSVVACVAPADTESEPASPSEASAVSAVTWNAVRECFNRNTGDCVSIPATFPNAFQDCVNFCIQIGGNPENQCRVTHISRAECQ
jgi:hypothetical protein